MAAFLSILLYTAVLWTHISAVCRLRIPECACVEGRAPDNNELECYAPSLWRILQTLADTSPDITSLHIRCGDRRENVIAPLQLAKFRHLTKLSIQSCLLTNLTSEAFVDTPVLKILTIEDCRFSDPNLEQCLFKHLNNLQYLNIHASYVTSLPSISHLTKLMSLKVARNRLKYINVGSADQEIGSRCHTTNYITAGSIESTPSFKYLRHLDISHNLFDTFPRNVIDGAISLEEIYFQENNISSFTVPAGEDFANVTTVDGTGNPLRAVSFPWEVTDVDSCRVRTLRLDGCGENSIELSKLAALRQVQNLRLRNFLIDDTVWTVLHSSQLHKIDLSENNLQTISISSMPSLAALIVAENNISQITPEMFSNQVNFLALNISHNALDSLPEYLFGLNGKVQALDFSHNSIRDLHPSALYGLSSLLLLYMHNNDIESIPEAFFASMTHLMVLDLHSNRLIVPPVMKSLGELTRLDLSHNEIFTMQTTGLMGLVKLELFNIAHNNLQVISEAELNYCPMLLEARYNHNNITQVGSFGKHPKLLSLMLHNNNIRESAKRSPFLDMQALVYLTLDSNNVSILRPDLFPPSLKTLSLSDNPLYNVLKNSFSNLPNLIRVNLEFSSRILFLPWYTVNIFGNHKPKPVFYLSNNVLRCSCYMAYLRTWEIHRFDNDIASRTLYHNYPKFEGLDLVECDKGGYLPSQQGPKYYLFQDVEESDFVCQYTKTSCGFLCHCCNSSAPFPDPKNCNCVVTCPSACSCYSGGGGFTEDSYSVYCRNRQLHSIPDMIPAKVTKLHLDGNELSRIYRDDLIHLRGTQVIYLNSSKAEYVEDRTFEDIQGLETAHHHVLKEGSHRLILVLIENIPDDLIDPDLQVLLKTRTYLKISDPWFWEKLYFALPDIRGREREQPGDKDVMRGMRILMGKGGDEVKGLEEVKGHDSHSKSMDNGGFTLDFDNKEYNVQNSKLDEMLSESVWTDNYQNDIISHNRNLTVPDDYRISTLDNVEKGLNDCEDIEDKFTDEFQCRSTSEVSGDGCEANTNTEQ